MDSLPKIVIVDSGSQYTLVIERSLRELGVRSVVLEPKRAGKWLASHPVNGIILSGGHASVYDEGAPQPPKEIFDQKVPILGICYGMQWLAQHLGGKVEAVQNKREYGASNIKVLMGRHELFKGTDSTQPVWASHGDSVVEVPEGFDLLAATIEGTAAAMSSPDGTLLGLQFHPEVTHTKFGKTILGNFLRICGSEADWQPRDIIKEIEQEVIEVIGDGQAVFGFSGGVDSTTLAAILSPVLGKRLHCVTIDGGHLRENELEEIRRHAEFAKADLHVIDARKDFEIAMHGLTDAEDKRRAFKKIYEYVLLDAARGIDAKFIIQGTLATDRIESGATGGAMIKSHHNVGLTFGGMEQLHPVDHLFKYEIRALARDLNLPESVHNREPFPGPGLFLRIVGTPVTTAKLELIRWADARVREIVGRYPIRQEISQLVTYYAGGISLVCVKGDARSYCSPVVVRPIQTVDFMTGRGVELPSEIRREILLVLCQHREIASVLWEETDKPPRTTEPE